MHVYIRTVSVVCQYSNKFYTLNKIIIIINKYQSLYPSLVTFVRSVEFSLEE